MHDVDMTAFETMVARRLRSYAAIEPRPANAREIARETVATRHAGLRWGPTSPRKVSGRPSAFGRPTAWIVAAGALFAAGALLALGPGGTRLLPPPSPNATATPDAIATPDARATATVHATFHLTGMWMSVTHPGETLVVDANSDGGPIVLGTVRDQTGVILMQDKMNANAGLFSLASTGVAGCSATAHSTYTIRVNPLADAFTVGNDYAGADPCPARAAVYGGSWMLVSSSLSPSTALSVDPAFDLTGLWMSAGRPGQTLVVDPSLIGGALPLSTIRDQNGLVVMQDYINAGQGLMALESTGVAGGCPTTEFHTYAFRSTPSGGTAILEPHRAGNPDPCPARVLAYHGVWMPIWRP
jgi:hypothetical protein